MTLNRYSNNSVILDDQELFYKRLRWDVLTLLAPLVLLLDIQVMELQSEKQFVLSCSAFFTLLVGMRITMGIKGRRKSFRTPQKYKWALLILGLQNFMISGAFVYMYKLHGLADSNTALILAVLIGLSSYVLFSFQLGRRYFWLQILSFSLPILAMPYFVPTPESWGFLGAFFIVSLYVFKTLRLNSHILMSIEDKGRVLEELNRITRKKILKGEMKLEDALPAFETIILQTKRAAKIVSSLRKFASVSSNEKMKKESLNMIMAESLDLCFEKFKKAGIKIHVELEYQGSLECRANEISQVILSLMNNAYEELISKESGDIYLRSHKIGDWVEISISDNGKGIPVDQMQRIFMPFFSTKAENKGIGLGLAVSKGVVESHGGELVYERLDGRSYFVLILPLSSEVKQDEIPEHFQEKIRRFEEMLRQYDWRIPAVE